MPLQRVRQHLTRDELSLWIAFGEVDGPWWEERADLLAARIAQTIAAAAGVERPLTEFLIDWTPRQQAAVILDWSAAAKVLGAMADRYQRGKIQRGHRPS